MKKILCVVFALVMLASLASCADNTGSKVGTVQNGKSVDDVLNSAKEETAPSSAFKGDISKLKVFSGKIPESEKYDVDLTSLNSTMVYTKVSDMVMNPDNYLGKSVKMSGTFAVAEGETRNYYACLIADATACCSQGIEFLPTVKVNYPGDFPPEGTDITVTGIFDTYYEGQDRFFQLKDASVYYAA